MGPVQSSTGIKGARDRMLPLIPPNYLPRTYYKNISHFLVLSDHFGTFWGYFGLVLGLNLKLSQTSHVTTQNDRKRSRMPMEMVSEVNLSMLRSFQDHLGPFEAILELFFGLNLKLSQTSHVTTQKLL